MNGTTGGRGAAVLSLERRSVHLDAETRAMARELTEAGLARSESAVIRTLCAAAMMKKEEIMGTFYQKVEELKRANPGMTWKEAATELSRRSGAKAHAKAERARRAEAKAKRYLAQLRRSEEGRERKEE